MKRNGCGHKIVKSSPVRVRNQLPRQVLPKSMSYEESEERRRGSDTDITVSALGLDLDIHRSAM